MASIGGIRAARAFIEITAKDGPLRRSLTRIQRRLKAFGASLKTIGAGLGKAVVPAGLLFGLSIKTFANFDDAMRTVKAVTQATSAEFVSLTAKARELGAATSFTATQVAQLQVALGRLGFSPTQIENMTADVLDLATATGTDLALAAEIAGATIKQFNLEASDMGDVANILVAGANRSGATLEDLGEAMGFAGKVADDFGVSLEDTTALLGALANVRIKGTMGGTALRRILLIMATEGGKIEAITKKSVADAAGNLRSPIQILEELTKSLAGIGNVERGEKLDEIFGLRGITGASALGQSGFDFQELAKAIEAAKLGDLAKKTAEEMEAGIGGAFRKLLSAVSEIGISIGEAVAGPLGQFADRAISIARAVGQWVSGNQELVASIGAAVVATFAIAGGLITASAAITGITFVIGALSAALGVVGSVAAFIVTPLGAVVAVLALIPASFLLVAIESEKFRETVVNSFMGILSTAKMVGSGLLDAFAAGDMTLAWEIAWAGLDLLWIQTLDGMLDSAIQWAKDLSRILIANFADIAEFIVSPGKRIAKKLLASVGIGGGGGGAGGGGLEGFFDRRGAAKEAARDKLRELTLKARGKRREADAAVAAEKAQEVVVQGFVGDLKKAFSKPVPSSSELAEALPSRFTDAPVRGFDVPLSEDEKKEASDLARQIDLRLGVLRGIISEEEAALIEQDIEQGRVNALRKGLDNKFGEAVSLLSDVSKGTFSGNFARRLGGLAGVDKPEETTAKNTTKANDILEAIRENTEDGLAFA